MAFFAVSLQIFRFFFFFFQKCYLLGFIRILSKSLNLNGCHGNIKGKFSSEATCIRGMKLKLSIHVHDISLYSSCIFIVVAHVLSLLWQLQVSIDL